MYDIETTEEFDNWLASIKDNKTQKVIRLVQEPAGSLTSLTEFAENGGKFPIFFREIV
jgi:hypothetical protein